MKNIMIRQGDVAIIARPHMQGEIPNTKLVSTDPHFAGKIVLAYGEVTGHAHTIESDTAQLLENEDGRRFLKLVAPEVLTHDEHAPINLPEGTYEVIIQSEYSPEAIRNVAD